MIEKIQNLVYRWLSDTIYDDDEQLYLHLLMHVANGFVALIHVSLFYIFFVIQVQPMVIFSACSVLLGVISIFLINARKYAFVGAALSIEIVAFVVYSSFLFSLQSYTFLFLFLVLIMQLVIPYGKDLIRIAMIIFVGVLSIVLIVLFADYLPPYPLGDALMFMQLLNTIITFIAILIEVTIGTILREIISFFHTAQLDEYKSQAYTDMLTGLYNRRYIDIYLSTLQQQSGYGNYAVAMLDIDDFKNVNDAYGHSVGDEVLIFLADFLTIRLRKSDAVFRWGGEELLILLGDVTAAVAYDVLDKIRESIANEVIVVNEHHIQISVTIGVADLDFDNIEYSINESDMKMYEGKRAGKNMVVI